MKICFQADADLNQNIVRALGRRAPAIDFQTAHQAGLHGVDDEAVLAQAAREAGFWSHTTAVRCLATSPYSRKHGRVQA